MKAVVGQKVEAYKNWCVGIIIDSVRYIGTVEKVNKKSFRVKFEEESVKHGRHEEQHFPNHGEQLYTYWKTTDDGREIYRSECNLYGMITFYA